jgi:DMSO/TMAO reductase YedYZ molybdopterin-dependent catalytic subunit
VNSSQRFPGAQPDLTRRRFLGLSLGVAGLSGLSVGQLWAQPNGDSPQLAEAIARLAYLTPDEQFVSFGRGNPPPCDLPLEKRRAVGLAQETWQLEVVPDADSDTKLDHPLSTALGTALNWEGLMQLAQKHAVRFLHVMSCTNAHAPLGMGLWEGVPLREVIWLTRPTANLRRVFYYGYHNDAPQQRFQSSLAIDRVLEDPPGELPVILAYKLNGQWLSPKRGGPVRLFVPDAYGNKSVKWLQRVVLTNNIHLNDTYAGWNNDTESHLKTCAFFLETPGAAKAGEAVPITGLAQVGMSGLRKVQCCLVPEGAPALRDTDRLAGADWRDAEILPPPVRWGGGLPEGRLPANTFGIDPATGNPRTWPLRNTIVHWAALLTDLRPGEYDLCCRTIDANGLAQPMPRPLLKSGYNAIQKKPLVVEA